MRRYGLAPVIGWIGFMKSTGYDAHGIQTLVAHSPYWWAWWIASSRFRNFQPGWELSRLL